MAKQAGEGGQPPSVVPIILAFLSSIAINAFIFYGGYYHCSCIPHPVPGAGLDSKLFYTLRCTLPLLVVLLTAIAMVGRIRGSSKALNPLAGHENLVQAQKNILNNTLEQLIVWLLCTGVLVTYLDGEEMRLVPLYAAAFVVGRVLFWLGYPKHRGWGMSINFTSSFLIVGFVVYFMSTRGLMFGIETADLGGVGTTGNKVEL